MKFFKACPQFWTLNLLFSIWRTNFLWTVHDKRDNLPRMSASFFITLKYTPGQGFYIQITFRLFFDMGWGLTLRILRYFQGNLSHFHSCLIWLHSLRVCIHFLVHNNLKGFLCGLCVFVNRRRTGPEHVHFKYKSQGEKPERLRALSSWSAEIKMASVNTDLDENQSLIVIGLSKSSWSKSIWPPL